MFLSTAKHIFRLPLLPPTSKNHDRHLYIQKGSGVFVWAFLLLKGEDMLQYIDVSDHRLSIHTMEKRYSLRMPLEKLKERLPQDGRFFQCHRGILVNLDRVSSLEKEVVILKNGDVLPVSRRNYHSFVTAQSTWNFRELREQFL